MLVKCLVREIIRSLKDPLGIGGSLLKCTPNTVQKKMHLESISEFVATVLHIIS